MEQHAQHPLLTRLHAALEAKGENKAAQRLLLAAGYYTEDDTEGLVSLVMRHCREYGIDPREVLGDGAPQCPPGIVMTPVFTMAATHPRTGRWRLAEIERIALSPRLLGPTRFVTRMDERALEPRIRQGAYLVVDTAQELPPAGIRAEEQGVPFALDLSGEGLVVRLTCYDHSRDCFELAALDSAQPPRTVPRETAGCRVVGRVVWVAQEL